MAIFYPSLDDIKLLKVKPEVGELYLLNFLNSILCKYPFFQTVQIRVFC